MDKEKEKKMEMVSNQRQPDDKDKSLFLENKTEGVPGIVNNKETATNVNPPTSEYTQTLDSLKLKEKTYTDKISQLEAELEKEKEITRIFKQTHQKIVDEKNKELKDKDKSYQTISVTNTKLMQTLEELRKEVDEQFDKMNARGLNKLKKKDENKQNPIEIVLKVKEKELKNATQLIDILRKDNEQLNRNLENYSDFKNVIELQDKLKVKERENFNLQQEVKLLNRTLEEHKRCPNIKANIENEVKAIKEEYRILKDSVKTQQMKKSDEDKTHQKLIEQYFALKKEHDKMKSSANVKDIKDTSAIDKLLSQVDKKKVNNFNHDSGVLEVLNSEDSKSNKKTERNTKSVAVTQRNKKNQHEDERQRLFSQEERAKLESLVSKKLVEKFEKKYEVLEYSKQSAHNKHKSDIKILNKKLTEQEEKMEFMNLQLKELDQKYKINQFQVNEYKNEQKAYQRKILEMQGHIEANMKHLKEKEQENKLLMSQLNSLRKIVKHNALPPIDNELARHLEKIKNEESNMNSFHNELNEILKVESESNQKEEILEPEDQAELKISDDNNTN